MDTSHVFQACRNVDIESVLHAIRANPEQWLTKGIDRSGKLLLLLKGIIIWLRRSCSQRAAQ